MIERQASHLHLVVSSLDLGGRQQRQLVLLEPRVERGNGAHAMAFGHHQRERQIKVASILGRHFAQVPRLSNPEQITLREEDKICAYYAGGTLYAKAERSEPLF